MRALVTGSSGFIGAHLCRTLRGRRWWVRGVDRVGSWERGRGIEHVDESVIADLRAAPSDAVRNLVSDVDVVFHLAGRAGVQPSWSNPEEYVDDNVLVSQRLFAACAGRDVRVVYASSSSVYGERLRPTPESAPLKPISPYAATKAMVEHLASAYATKGLDAVGLRYFTVYGPRQRPDMAIARFIAAARAGQPLTIYGDGLQRRDLTYVDDAVDATIRAARNGPPGAIYNVSSGWAAVTILKLAELLKADVKHEPAKPGDVGTTWGDSELVRHNLGYVPQVGIEEGLRSQQAANIDTRPSGRKGSP